MNGTTQQAKFKQMGIKTFYIGQFIKDSKRATVMLEGAENVLYEFLPTQLKNYCWSLWSYL